MLPINLLTRDCQVVQTAVAVRGNDSLSPLCLFEMAALFTQKCAEAKRFVFWILLSFFLAYELAIYYWLVRSALLPGEFVANLLRHEVCRLFGSPN